MEVGLAGVRFSGGHRIIFNFPLSAILYKMLATECDRIIVVHFLSPPLCFTFATTLSVAVCAFLCGGSARFCVGVSLKLCRVG